MPKDFTEAYLQKEVLLEQDELIESFVVDLCSVSGYVSFSASGHTITSRDRDGVFPITRIRVGDIIEITGTVFNNDSFTVVSVTSTILTVSEAVADESLVFASFSNYLYYIRYAHDVYGFKMENGLLVNTNQLYTGAEISREDIKNTTDLGSQPQVKFTVSNINRVVEALIQNRKFLRGCFFYFISEWAEHFPVGAGYQYLGTSSDYLSCSLDKFKVNRVISNVEVVTFECIYKFGLRDIVLPSRMVSTTYCEWSKRYGCIECDPTTAIDYGAYPTCDGTLKQCRIRENSRRWGGFPGIPRGGIYI